MNRHVSEISLIVAHVSCDATMARKFYLVLRRYNIPKEDTVTYGLKPDNVQVLQLGKLCEHILCEASYMWLSYTSD